jgi:hypothetical protein
MSLPIITQADPKNPLYFQSVVVKCKIQLDLSKGVDNLECSMRAHVIERLLWYSGSRNVTLEASNRIFGSLEANDDARLERQHRDVSIGLPGS